MEKAHPTRGIAVGSPIQDVSFGALGGSSCLSTRRPTVLRPEDIASREHCQLRGVDVLHGVADEEPTPQKGDSCTNTRVVYWGDETETGKLQLLRREQHRGHICRYLKQQGESV